MMRSAGDAQVIVDAERGGRVASLRIGGRELLLQPDEADGDPTLWGLYPMVPWAGRVRDGRFAFDGVTHQLPLAAPPHALHGVGYTAAWDEVGPARLRVDLDWPLGGWAEQEVELTASALTLRLTVGNDEQPMPAVVGYHPCFRRRLGSGDGARLEVPATAMWRRDGVGLPDGRRVGVPPGPWDDAFELDGSPSVVWPGTLALTLTADTTTWVVYDEDPRVVCVEPQTDAPDAFNRPDPTVVAPGRPRSLTLTLDWSPA